MTEKTVHDTLNLLIKAVRHCVTESHDKVSQSLLAFLKTLATNISPDPEGRERDRRTMRGLVLLIKERLEGVNALGATLCGCLAETILLLTFKDTASSESGAVTTPAGKGKATVPTDRCKVKAGNMVIEVPKWALQAFHLRQQGVKYSEIGKQFGVSRQLAQYWVRRLETLNLPISEEPKVLEAPPTEPQSPPSPPDETLWQLLKGKVKG